MQRLNAKSLWETTSRNHIVASEVVTENFCVVFASASLRLCV
jgi:hypothetical protein